MRNKKASITLRNRTNYFDPEITRTKVHISSPESYQNIQIKIEGYETRLYWQFKYCEDHQGQTFFYTLTYNDKSLPHHYGINCFDYEDLRDLLTGGFRKKLLRQYGTTFKYFIGAELGDGKGERGMHNNPHYHILFFLEPANNDKYPYRMIDPVDFRHLVRMYWQGFDEDKTGYQDYNTAKYGISKEGDNIGKVIDFRAIQYVAKYVTKDVKLKDNESNVERRLNFVLTRKMKDTEDIYRMFFKEYINEWYNIPTNPSKTTWTFTEAELIEYLVPGTFMFEKELYNMDVKDIHIDVYSPYVPIIINKLGLYEDYCQFVRDKVSVKVKEGVNEWRNRYSNKCRISQGVGDYAIKDINPMDPTIKVPSKKGFKKRPISMYYYRKIYTDVVKDKITGQNLYILNETGQKYKLSKLPSQIKKMSDQTSSYIQLIADNKELFDKMRSSNINTVVDYTYEGFQRLYSMVKGDIQNIIKRYAEYKLVYEDRFFKVDFNRNNNGSCFPDIDVFGDYQRFLVPTFTYLPRNDFKLGLFLEDTPQDYLPYIQHPYFLQYYRIFNLFDLCSDYFFVQGDDKRQKEAEDIASVRRFHKQLDLKRYYSSFVG